MSPISLEPNKGVRLQLANYVRTRSFQGGGEFWETQFQQIIRQCLGDFLPRAEQDQPGSVLFQHFVGSEEVCSKSEPIDGRIPTGELQRLERCIQSLKAKEADPQTDSNARKLIQAFKLPDPAKDPELYRVHGSRHNRKLLVLWGVEKESLSSLDPLTAVSRVRERTGSGKSLAWLWWLLAALLLLLVAWLLFQRLSTPRGAFDELNVPPYTPGETAPAAPGHSRPGPLANTDSPGTPARPSSTSSDAPALPGLERSQPAPSSPAAPSPTGERPMSPSDNRPAAPDSQLPPPPPEPSKSSPPVASPPTGNPPQSPEPATPPKPASQPPISQDPAKPSANPTVQPPPGAPPPPSASPKSAPGETPPAPPPAPPSPAGNKPPGALSAPTPPSPPAGPQAALEIINTSSDDTPRDGKVKVELKALLRDKSGQPARLGKVSGWSIDGQPQLDTQGQKNADPTLSTQLPKGTHRVEVTGTDADGNPLRTAVDIEVGIQSSIRLKPAP